MPTSRYSSFCANANANDDMTNYFTCTGGDFCVYDQLLYPLHLCTGGDFCANDDITDYFTPCTCMRGN